MAPFLIWEFYENPTPAPIWVRAMIYWASQKMMTDPLPFLTIFLGTIQKMKASMLCGVTCPPTVATVMLKDMPSLIVQRKIHPMSVGTAALVATLLLNAQKVRISHLKRPGRLLLLHRIEQIKMMYAQSSGLFSGFLLLTILISGLSAVVCFPLSGMLIEDLLLTAFLLLINSWSFVLCRSLPPSKGADSTLTSMFNHLHCSLWFIPLSDVWLLL